jgi:RNA polymerase sigma-70 factor (ECF subfamily)
VAIHAGSADPCRGPGHDIVELLRGAADRAFALVLDRYESKVYRLCCTLLRDRTQAEDAAQESLIRIWKALPSYDQRASLSTWIYAVTRNRCLSILERRREAPSLSETEIAAQASSLAAADPSDDDACEQLRKLVDLLAERQRRVLVLYYYEERSVSEVAEMLAMPEGTVKTVLHRARAALSEKLRERGLDPGMWLETDS